MKRLQFRHHDEVFESRQKALEYFANIVNPGRVEHDAFGPSLYGEPIVAKYSGASGTQLMFAIGVVDSGDTLYHIIDSADIYEKLTQNANDIAGEIARAIEKDDDLQAQISAISGSVEENVAEIVSVEPSSPNVLEEYVLKNNSGVELGEHIKVYKDSALVWVQLGYKDAKLERNPETGEYDRDENGNYIFHYTEPIDYTTYLYLIYSVETGDLKMVGLNIEEYITESEFSAGLEVNGHVVSVKIDALSEPFLTVSNDGIKLAGVQDAIDSAKTEATSYVDEKIAEETTARENADTALAADITSALNEAKEYTTNAYISAKTYTDEAKAECNTRMDGIDQAIADMGDSSEAYTDEKIAELSGNTVNAISGAVEESKAYTNKLRIKQIANPDPLYSAQYRLEKVGEETPIGDLINIPKQSQIDRIIVGRAGDSLNEDTGVVTPGVGPAQIEIIYTLPNGKYSWAILPVSQILADYAFGNGLTTNDGVVSIEIAPNEEFLWADPSGIGTSGIRETIRTSVETSYSAITSETNAKLEQLANVLNERISGNTTAIYELHEEVTGINDRVLELGNMVVDISTKVQGIEELSALTIELRDEINNLSGEVSTNTENIEELSGTVETFSGKIDELSGAVESHIADFVIVSGKVEELSDAIGTINDNISELSGSVVTGLNDANGRMNAIEGRLDAIEGYLYGSGLTQAIYNALTTMVTGTPSEIKVTDNGSGITIGFTDDAIFGEPEE